MRHKANELSKGLRLVYNRSTQFYELWLGTKCLRRYIHSNEVRGVTLTGFLAAFLQGVK